jgi:hypothetical protein
VSKRLFAAIVLAGFTAAGLNVAAHKGHAHKIMGTISLVHENHVEIETKDGKKMTVTLNDKTKILKGKAKASASDLKEGVRVVVEAEGEKEMVAKTVRLAGDAKPVRSSGE